MDECWEEEPQQKGQLEERELIQSLCEFADMRKSKIQDPQLFFMFWCRYQLPTAVRRQMGREYKDTASLLLY